MAPRAAIRKILGTDPELIALGFPEEKIFSSAAVDSPDRKKHWMIITCTEDAEAFPGKAPQLIEVWVYQPQGLGRNYDTLDAALVRVRELLAAAEHFPGDDGWILTSSKYVGGSRDLFDDVFSAYMKFATFKVSSRYAVTP